MHTVRKLQEYYQPILVNDKQWALGFGAYGTVTLAKCLKTNQTVAVKKILRKIAKNEVSIHISLNHHNIIKLIDYFYDELNFTTFLVLQYASKGTLYDFIKQGTNCNHFIIKNMFKSVCEAINYLHSHNIMHRDIKPQNILLDKNYNIKLCDFGFANKLETRMTLCGTAEYMSPEMILRKSHDEKVDVWSLGILLFELIEGHAPFEGTSQEQILQKMKQKLYFSKKFKKQQIQIIQNILKVNPKQRPTINQILNYSWFNTKTKQQDISNRSTMSQQKQSRIKILNVRELPQDKIQINTQTLAIKNCKKNKNDSLISKNQSVFKTNKISLRKNSKQN